jgi:hypothetical protein
MYQKLHKMSETKTMLTVGPRTRDSHIVDYSSFSEFTPSVATKFVMGMSIYLVNTKGAMALFEIPVDKVIRERQWIQVLAIQVIPGKGEQSCKDEIFYPAEGIRWKIGKAIFQSLDG